MEPTECPGVEQSGRAALRKITTSDRGGPLPGAEHENGSHNKHGWSKLAGMTARWPARPGAGMRRPRAGAGCGVRRGLLHKGAAAKALGKKEIVREVCHKLASIKPENFPPRPLNRQPFQMAVSTTGSGGILLPARIFHRPAPGSKVISWWRQQTDAGGPAALQPKPRRQRRPHSRQHSKKSRKVRRRRNGPRPATCPISTVAGRLRDKNAGGKNCQPGNDQRQRRGQRQKRPPRHMPSRQQHGPAKSVTIEETAGQRRHDTAQQIDKKDAAQFGGSEVERRLGEINSRR